MLSFAGAYFFMVATPGPGVLTTAGVGAGYGFRPGLSYVAGLWLGNLLVGLIVASGVWAAASAVPGLRVALGIVSLAYLGWLAAKIALAGAKVGFGAADRAPRFRNGLFLQFVNPKAYAVSTIFFSNFPMYPDNWWLEVAVKMVIINVLWVPIHFAWLYAGVAVQRLDLPDHIQRRINYGMAAALVCVVLLAALRG